MRLTLDNNSSSPYQRTANFGVQRANLCDREFQGKVLINIIMLMLVICYKLSIEKFFKIK